MKSKPQHLVKRILVLLLTLSILWSDASFVSLAQTIGEQTVDLQGETPSEEPAEEATQEPSTDPVREPAESADPTQEPAEPTQEPVEPTQEPIEPTQEPAEPTQEPSAEPAETPESTEMPTPLESPEPSEMPEGEETPMPSETPSMTPGQEKLTLDTATEEEDDGRFSFRIGDADENWNPDTGAKITAESVIKIYDNNSENPKYLARDDVKGITWFAEWIGQEGAEPYEIGKDITELDLSQQFFPFAFQVSVEFTLKDGDKRSMWLGNVEPSETQEAPEDALEGLPMPGCTLSLNAEDVMEGNCFFIRAKDEKGTNSVCVGGGGTSYEIQNGDNGQYIYVKYAVRNSEGQKSNFRTAAVRVGYSMETTDAAKKANAELLQNHINELAEIAQEWGQQELRIPAGVQIAAESPITLYDGITLVSEAGTQSEQVTVPTFTGGIVVKKYKKDGERAGRARIENLWLVYDAAGTVIDASEDVCVVVENCQFDINKNATFLKVSKESYAFTELNYSRVKFNAGGTLLGLTDASSMPSVFRLGNAELSVKVVNSDVTMLGSSGNVKWNVDNLSPMDRESVRLLSAGNNVINNVFGIEGVDGMLSNSKELTVDSVHDKWISPVLADGSHFSSDGAKISVWAQDSSTEQYTEQYTVMAIPEDCNWGFRPYAVTETYVAGKGSYSKLLPAGYLAYVVIDVNQKDGFPYGAVVEKEINVTEDNFVVMQYHQDKSVEMVASVENGEVVGSKDNSGFAGINKTGDGKYRILAHTRVNGEEVAEPVVLAVYAGVPGAQTKLSVYEEKQVYDENGEIKSEKIPSDGKILTHQTNKVYLELNGGIVKNYCSSDRAFTVDNSKLSGGEAALNVSENGASAELEIPMGTYGTVVVTACYKGSEGAGETKISYTLQVTTIADVDGITVSAVNSGKKYYGTATFDILSGDAKPLVSVKAQNGERGSLKIISSSQSGSKVTIQYALDLRDSEAWGSIAENPPFILVETTAGTWGIPFCQKESNIYTDVEAGVAYIRDENNCLTGILVIDGEKFYHNEVAGMQILTISENAGIVKMAEGCLSNIYENGTRARVPEVVVIPATVEEIQGPLVTDKDYSNLRQIVVSSSNSHYCTYGEQKNFGSEGYDEADYSALYKKNGNKTELVEIASNYYGKVEWRGDAQWTDDTYKLDFSNIEGFRCGDDSSYAAWDGILVELGGNGVGGGTAVWAPENMGTAVVIPEGVTKIKAKALENTTAATLVLPYTLTQWEEGAVTQAKNIYVYNSDTSVNPVSGMADSVKGVTFYGFTDASGNSALKTWVSGKAKSHGYKFTAMKESGSDYTARSLRDAITVRDAEGNECECYIVNVGDLVSRNYDFDFASNVTNGYSGKADLYVSPETDDKYYKIQDEFEYDREEDGMRAVNPGVQKLTIRRDDHNDDTEDPVIKTVYFVVRPIGWFDVQDVTDGYVPIPFGETGNVTTKFWQWNDESKQDEPYSLSEDTLQEYEALGVLRVVTPDERNADGRDAWKIERQEQGENGSSEIVYAVTPQLDKDSKGNIKGGESSAFILEMFGDRGSVWVETRADWEGNLVPDNDEWNPLLEKKEIKEIPIMRQAGEGDEAVTAAVDYSTTSNGVDVPLVACEVISGNKFVDAVIENKEGKAVLKLTAKADGKAQVRVYTPYANNEMYLDVSVGSGLVGRFALTLWENQTEETTLDSTIDSNDVSYERVFDINGKDEKGDLVWKSVIPVSDINNTTVEVEDADGNKTYPELASAKLTWTVSDTALATLVKDTKDKNKVTGIQLKGEGTVLVTATVKDTNAAAIRMLFTVKDVKPRLHNDSASLDLYKVGSTAEYTFAVPEGVAIKGDSLAIAKAVLNKKEVAADAFEVNLTGEDKISVSIADGKAPAAGKYTLTFRAGITCDADGEEGEDSQDMGPYEYTVTLQLGGSVPKATVTAADAMDLSIPSKRESALTVKLGDTVNSAGTTITLDKTDTLTNNFSTYFALESDNGEYKVRFVNAGGKTPAEIVKLFNGKKIKLTVASTDYSKCTEKAEVSFKISATTPALKAAGNGKVTVNTTDVTTYRANDAAIGLEDGKEAYTAGMSYTLTDGFVLLNDSMDNNSTSGSIDMEIAAKQKDYADKITFWQEGEEIIAMAAPGVPKGTYTFTWTPRVKAVGDDIYAEGQSLKSQKISVVVTTSSAKVTLSSAKLTVNKNYIYTEGETQIQFDESQIQTLYGYDRWMENYDAERTQIDLTKEPKGATETKPDLWVDGDRIRVTVSEDVTAGEYKYSITPYVTIGRWEMVQEGGEDEEDQWDNVFRPMALAPVTLTVQVTETLPTASLAQTTVTLDNNDMSAMALIKWDIKGDYQQIAGPWDEDEDPENGDVYERHPEYVASCKNGPVVYLEGNEIRVQVTNDTLKGTYKIPVTPRVVLDSYWNNEEKKETKNIQPLKEVVLTVKVNSTRPTLKLEKSALTAYSSYPGGEDGEEYYVPAEANTEISASNGYGIGALEIVPADTKTKAIQDNSETAIMLSEGRYPGDNCIHCFDIIPTTSTPNGTYNYLLYSWLYGGEDEENNPIEKERALEPVKLKVTIKNSKPKLQLSASSVLLPAGRHGSTVITLQGQTECVQQVTTKTEYLVKNGGKYQLTEEESDNAYATLETLEDGTVIITSSENAEEVNKAAVSYKQEVTLKGNDTPYDASYNLTFNLKKADPKAVLSTKTVTVNKNYSEWEQNNCVTLTLDNGEKIVGYDINNTSEVISIKQMDEESNEYAIVYRVFFAKPDQVKKGKYKIKLTPYVQRGAEQKPLSPVELTVDVTDALPTVSASQTKVTINKLDTRENTYQRIHLKPSLPYADVEYDVAVTKGPKGVNLSEVNFIVEPWYGRETDLVLGSTDTKMQDGSYTVTVTPYTWKDGKQVDLKKINITVTVNSPKITAAVQAPKVTIDLATANSVEVRNSILLTGTNADLVWKIYWKEWELTKKPKGAEDNIWIDGLYAEDGDEGRNGKDFTICWGDSNSDEKYINVTPGTYEFTLTPAALQPYDGVNATLPTPGAIKLTVTVKNSMPTVKYGKTSSKMNLAFTNEDSLFTTLSDASWSLMNVDAVMTSWPKGAGEEKSALTIDYEGEGSNRLRIRGSDKVPEGTYTFLLEPEARKNGIVLPLKEQKYTVTVKNEIPTAKASSSKLTCNVLYTENYWYNNEEKPFSKKQQTKLTLSKNYGPSHFEDVKIAFTGKAAQQAEAAKIQWYFDAEDGTLVAMLQRGSVVATGSYAFEATPVIRSDTGTKMTLKPVKLTVAVENKAIKASAKASGKIDLLNREGSGITYKVTLSDNDADSVEWIGLTGPEKGNDESWRFEVIRDEDGQNPAECIVRAKDANEGGDELSTKVNYEMRLEVHTIFGKTYYVPVKIKPTQSKLTAKADVTAVSLFKQASEGTAAVTEIKATINNTPAGEMQILTEERENRRELLTGNADFRVLVIEPETPPVEDEGAETLSAAEEPKSVTVKVLFASEQAKGKYKAGSKVTLPIYVNVHNQAADTYNTVKVNLTVNIKN